MDLGEGKSSRAPTAAHSLCHVFRGHVVYLVVEDAATFEYIEIGRSQEMLVIVTIDRSPHVQELREQGSSLHHWVRNSPGAKYSRMETDEANEGTAEEVGEDAHFVSHNPREATPLDAANLVDWPSCPDGKSFTITASKVPVIEGCYHKMMIPRWKLVYTRARRTASEPHVLVVSAPLDPTKPKEVGVLVMMYEASWALAAR